MEWRCGCVVGWSGVHRGCMVRFARVSDVVEWRCGCVVGWSGVHCGCMVGFATVESGAHMVYTPFYLTHLNEKRKNMYFFI